MLDRLKNRVIWKPQSRLYNRRLPSSSAKWFGAPEIDVRTEGHGSAGATYTICPDRLEASSVVYSFGVGADIAFELSLIERYGSEVHAFDPTEQSADFIGRQELPASFHFHKLALADTDGEVTLQGLTRATPYYFAGTLLDVQGGPGEAQTVRASTLETIMSELGHDRIDVLKLDIEGGEFAVLEALGTEGIPAEQIALELHPHIANLESHGLMLGRAGWRRAAGIVERLRANGYRLFHRTDRGTELSFIRAEPDAE